MKKILLFILILLTSCASTNKKQESTVIHNLNADFPTVDTILMEKVQSFGIAPIIYSFMVRDSVMFVLEKSKDNFGHCYSLSTGERLSTLLGRGNAAYEMINIPPSGTLFWGDSIQFMNEDLRLVKTIAINDILSKPLGKRKFSTIILPDTLPTYSFSKIGNNKIIGSLTAPEEVNDCRYFIYDNGEIFKFGNFNLDVLFPNTDFKEGDYRNSVATLFALYGDKIVTTDVGNGVMLQVIDAQKRVITEERYYTSKRGEPLLNYGVGEIRCNEKFIYCVISMLNREKTKEARENINEQYILVFDWKLNPVKKYFLTGFPEGSCRYYTSEDGKYSYYLTNPESGQQELFRGVVY